MVSLAVPLLLCSLHLWQLVIGIVVVLSTISCVNIVYALLDDNRFKTVKI